MFDVSRIFAKVFVREFYRLNAGFFMIIITLTFGFMSGVEHRALAEFFVASPQLTVIPVAVWAGYTIKVIAFNRQRLFLPENVFLYNFSVLSYRRQLGAALQALFTQLMPAILYGSFLIAIALKNGLIQPVLIVIAALAALHFCAAHLLVLSLRTPIHEPKISAAKRFIDRHMVRPIWWMYLATVLRREPLLFIGTKIFSGLLLFSVMQLYHNESFDSRLLGMAASVAGVANFMLMMHFQLFDLHYFMLVKNLPITLSLRWFRIVVVTVVAVLPEIIVLIKYSPVLPVTELFFIMLLIPATALVAYALRYFSLVEETTYSRLIFAVAMGHVVLILFRSPMWMVVAADLTTSWLIFRSRYYTFEFPATPKK
ncbi:MAG TPA: hypothetical protein VGD31_10455 [Sphingobacteriaceae bacterium]